MRRLNKAQLKALRKLARVMHRYSGYRFSDLNLAFKAWEKAPRNGGTEEARALATIYDLSGWYADEDGSVHAARRAFWDACKEE